MLKTGILAAVALSFVALGAPSAYAGGGGHHGHWSNGIWLSYSWYPSCHYETRKIRIKYWDRNGYPHFKWVWRDIKVC